MTNPNCLSACGLVLDLTAKQVLADGQLRRLTPKECRLLATFMRHSGQVLTRALLMKKVWDTDYVGDCRTLEVHVCTLRRKIGPHLIHTARGVGYRFGK